MRDLRSRKRGSLARNVSMPDCDSRAMTAMGSMLPLACSRLGYIQRLLRWFSQSGPPKHQSTITGERPSRGLSVNSLFGCDRLLSGTGPIMVCS
jgi:hypothetical protein